jgi:hypothetical protein
VQSRDDGDYYIDSIRFQEFGDTTLTGTGGSATRSSVAASLFAMVTEVDNVALDFPIFSSLNMSVPGGGAWTLAGGPITGQLWSGSLSLNLTTLLQAWGVSGHATEVYFSLDNTLTTSSEVGSSSFIAKKAAGLTVTPIILEIPEPGTVSVLLLGIGLFFLKRR